MQGDQVAGSHRLSRRLGGGPAARETAVYPLLEPTLRRLQVCRWCILTSPKGDKLRYVLYLDFIPCTNKVAEYEALLHGMRAAKEMNINRLRYYGDSDLVAGQVAGTCDAVSPTMAAYSQAVD